MPDEIKLALAVIFNQATAEEMRLAVFSKCRGTHPLPVEHFK
jgi:hypothetical protein